MHPETLEPEIAGATPIPSVDQQPPKPRLFPLFTRENAREYQARATEARKRNRLAAQEANARPPQPAPVPMPVAPQSSEYAALQVARVRGHIDRLDELIDAATATGDAQAIERLMRARGIAEELERRASDRRLPPTVRVAEVKTGQRSGLLSGLPDAP